MKAVWSNSGDATHGYLHIGTQIVAKVRFDSVLERWVVTVLDATQFATYSTKRQAQAAARLHLRDLRSLLVDV